MNFIIHPDAELEFYNAVAYYNEQVDGLGDEFAQEVFSSISRIVRLPRARSPLSANIRRCLCERFPYGLIYEIIDEENFTILAIAHLSREPNYWTERLN